MTARYLSDGLVIPAKASPEGISRLDGLGASSAYHDLIYAEVLSQSWFGQGCGAELVMREDCSYSARVVIRLAEPKDLPAILGIYNHAVLNTTASYDYEPRDMNHRVAWFELHRKQDLPVFVAETEDDVIGWSSLSRYHDRIGYRFTVEDSVYIAEPHRGKGVGKALLAPLIQGARERNLRAIIGAIDADNKASIRLHAGFGFEKVGHFKKVGFKFERWLDVVYMELLL